MEKTPVIHTGESPEPDPQGIGPQFRDYLRENFSETTWWPAIVGVRVDGAIAILTVRQDATDDQIEGIHRGGSSFVFDQTRQPASRWFGRRRKPFPLQMLALEIEGREMLVFGPDSLRQVAWGVASQCEGVRLA